LPSIVGYRVDNQGAGLLSRSDGIVDADIHV
jgi:hypothetical protein